VQPRPESVDEDEKDEEENSGGESIGEEGWGDSAEEGSVDYARDEEEY
jgi:hypothetical protein